MDQWPGTDQFDVEAALRHHWAKLSYRHVISWPTTGYLISIEYLPRLSFRRRAVCGAYTQRLRLLHAIIFLYAALGDLFAGLL